MIIGVWIIHKQNGLCLFYKEYHGEIVGPDLFSGFLSSIHSFSEEITKTGGIETLELKEMNILYCIVANLIFILVVTKDENKDYLRERVSDISKAFLDKYKKEIDTYRGEVSIFKPFERDLHLILEKIRSVGFLEVAFKLPQNKHLKLSEEEFVILSECDGKTPIEALARKLNISEIKLGKVLKRFEKKNIIKRKMVMKIS
ncbi:MAG: hypothetical protein ACFFG0_07105 [Candidatus Thorarchaeota archaeon]